MQSKAQQVFPPRKNTKHNWRHNRHNHGSIRRKWPPRAPHEASRSAPMHRIDGWQPPELAELFFGGLRVFMALKALLCSGDDESPQHRSVLRAIHTLNSPQNYIRKLGGLSPIHSTHQHGAQGLIWGTRGPLPPAVAMVGYGCVGWCWPLEAYVSSTYCRNSKNCLQKYFFYSYVDPIHSWHLTRQLNKEDLDLCTWAFRCFLCPIFYGRLRFIFARDNQFYLILRRIVPGKKQPLVQKLFFVFCLNHGAEWLWPLPWPVVLVRPK